MEKVKKEKDSERKLEQIIRLDKVLQKSAALIISEFVESGDADDPFRDLFELKVEWIDQLEEQFKDSQFYHGEKFDTGNAFDTTMYSLIDLNDEIRMRILYPILFYTLIMKNFTNTNTINRREKRGSKSWGNTSDLLEIPLELEKEKDRQKLTAKLRDDIEHHTGKIKERLTEIHGILTKEVCEDLYFEWRELNALLLHADTAVYLLDGRKIAWMEAMARRTLFLRDILESQKTHCSPIDTILRLYILNAIDRSPFTAECFSNSFRDDNLPGDFLLTSYLKYNGEPLEIKITKGEQGTENQEQKNDVSLEEPVEISDDFSWLYGQLCQLTFTPEDVDDILEYFFHESSLKWYLDCDKHIHKFAEAVLRGLKDFENINEKYFDTLRLSAPQTTKVFEEEMFCIAKICGTIDT